MTANDHDKRILEALDPTAETPGDQRIREALNGQDYLFGLSEPQHDYDTAVEAWSARESLKTSAERYARAGSTRLDDQRMEQIVSEVYEATNKAWTDISRMQRTAGALDRLAAMNERLR